MAENNGKPWDDRQDRALLQCYEEDLTNDEIGQRMGRTEYAIYCRLKYLGVNPDDCNTKTIKPENSAKEPIMKNRTVSTKTFVGDVDASTLSVEQLLDVIEQEQSFIERLAKLPSSAAKNKLLDRHSGNLQALNKILEGLL